MSAVALGQRFVSLVRLEHTVFALPYAYVGRDPRRRRLAGHRGAGLDHRRDVRRALVRDGGQPPGRRGDRRAQPAHRGARAARRAAQARRR